tara:strand:+ start:245 stop:1195 length:951 start_codon:yes stop_codon:yes gene_type:complete
MAEKRFSVIVIGRNEGENLQKCFDSISKVKETVRVAECIYVDSDSTDQSLRMANEHASVDIVIKISGEINSAIARNVGADKSTGEILFFVDGDMEICPTFLEGIWTTDGVELVHPVITGDMINVIDGEQQYYYGKPLESDQYTNQNGGLFMIERDIWIRFGGMDNRFKRSQDLEFFLRLDLNGIKILRKREVLCYHNTYQYHHQKRIYSALKSGYQKYSGLIYRLYFFEFSALRLALRRDYTAFLLLFLLPLCLTILPFMFLLVYPIAIFARMLLAKRGFDSLFLLYRIVSDFNCIYGLLFFSPSRDKKYLMNRVG